MGAREDMKAIGYIFLGTMKAIFFWLLTIAMMFFIAVEMLYLLGGGEWVD